MFEGTTNFNPFNGVTDWDTSNVTNMEGMFYNSTSFNGDMQDWDTSNVTNMSFMFNNATAFSGGGNIYLWDISSVETMEDMLSNSACPASAYSDALVNWKIIADNVGVNLITLGAAGVNYITSVADTSRSYLINDLSWSITDAGGI
jgi:surface protein